MARTALVGAAVLAGLVPGAWAAADAVTTPQPSSPVLPNHAWYLHGTDAVPYVMTFDGGSDPRAVDDLHVFEPARGRLPIHAAPVVVIFHGYGMEGPGTIDAFIRFLTRRGMTVLHPAYLDVRTDGNPSDFADWVARSHDAIARGLALLEAPGHVRPLRDRRGVARVAYVAHSIGSYVAAFVAERAADDGVVPPPLAIVMADPAGHDYAGRVGIDMDQSWDLDPRTELVILAAEATLEATNARGAVEDFLGYLPVDCRHRSAWVVPHDSEQGVALVSDHLGFLGSHPTDPTARLDAIDWWGYWLHVAAHLEHAFHGIYGGYRHGGGVYNGLWLDAATGHPLRFAAWKRPHPSYPLGHGCAPP